ncbi:MAG TPA: GGDEF domain-containing protein [Nitrobacter sp.]|nr:GGDEF domain-containing protein [Nitrobacter sp.]
MPAPSPRDAMADPVYVEIVGALYNTAVPIVVAGLAQVIVGTIVSVQSGDVVVALVTAGGALNALVRAFCVRAYRRALRTQVMDRAAARRWERIYTFGGNTTAALIGIFTLRCFMLPDQTNVMMANGLAFGFASGVIARGSIRPFYALQSIGLVGFPIIAGCLFHPDASHLGLALLIAIYMAGCLTMVRASYAAAIEQIALKQRLAELARLDPLTGLLNRSTLDTDVAAIMSAGEARGVAIHSLDLDLFKEANDRFGHPVGDRLLKSVAQRLRQSVGGRDLVIRMGGDEFVIVQQNVAGRADARRLAHRVVEALTQPYVIDGHTIEIGTSFGVAIAPDDGSTPEILLSQADRALYASKRGRGGVVFASDVPSLAPDEDSEIADLLAAPPSHVRPAARMSGRAGA